MKPKRRKYQIIFLFVLLLSLLFGYLFNPNDLVRAQNETPTPQPSIVDLLNRLTPEEKIGQLFLVTFTGTDVGPDSEIYQLITQYHIGGVILLSNNDNFTYITQSPDETALQALELAKQLQQSEYNASIQDQQSTEPNQEALPTYIPLLIGISQDGDGYPFDQILNGLTTLPNQMSIGATWNQDLATEIGRIQGDELASIGINLLLGPSLDILEAPLTDGNNDLGTRSFGGDPYWVGKLGRAYIQGVHQGSRNRIIVTAKHFPGQGSADRLPEEEVATVRKSLEELNNFDLLPFFDATGNAPSDEETSDALLTSHIRYQGLQGNIRATTRPVSLDPQAFKLLMDLPALSAWRKNGGVMISDDLGSQAIRKFYELTSQTFDARRVTLNAFLAGNDMLYVSDFSTSTDTSSFTEAVRTLEFFAQKYREDIAFAQRVDESVLKLLTLKYNLYPNFSLADVLDLPPKVSEIGISDQTIFEVAREAASLISPSQPELDETIPDPPNENDRIVFLTDTRTAQQCSQCSPQPLLDVKALQEFVIRRYGPQAGGQITSNFLSSYSLADLEEMLNSPSSNTAVERDLNRANWIVFSMLDASNDYPSYQILRRFLAERPDLFQQKRVFVFSFNAPYYLDATNISKLTAYYALYSKQPQFIDVAAYLLFRELVPGGSSPVSITGINYDINKVMFPDPNQVISLELDLNQSPITDTINTPTPSPTPEFRVGDVIPVRTGVILDHNGHPVPDGTPVDFILSTSGTTSSVRQEVTTQDGIARSTFSITEPGTLEILAESEAAKSIVLRFDIPIPVGESEASLSEVAPSNTPSPPPTAAIIFVPRETTPTPSTQDRLSLEDWIMASLVSLGIGWIIYQFSKARGQVRWGVRSAFLAIIGGMVAYIYLALELPGSTQVLSGSISSGVLFITLSGLTIGLIIGLLWWAVSRKQKKSIPQEEIE